MDFPINLCFGDMLLLSSPDNGVRVEIVVLAVTTFNSLADIIDRVDANDPDNSLAVHVLFAPAIKEREKPDGNSDENAAGAG